MFSSWYLARCERPGVDPSMRDAWSRQGQLCALQAEPLALPPLLAQVVPVRCTVMSPSCSLHA